MQHRESSKGYSLGYQTIQVRSVMSSKRKRVPSKQLPTWAIYMAFVAIVLFLAGAVYIAVSGTSVKPVIAEKGAEPVFDAELEAQMIEEVVRLLAEFEASRPLQRFVKEKRVQIKIEDPGDGLPPNHFGITYYHSGEILLSRSDLAAIFRRSWKSSESRDAALKLSAIVAFAQVAHELYHFATQDQLAKVIGDGPVLATLEDEVLAQCNESRLTLEVATKHPRLEIQTGDSDWDSTIRRRAELYRQGGADAILASFKKYGGKSLPCLFDGSVEEARRRILTNFEAQTPIYLRTLNEVKALREKRDAMKDAASRRFLDQELARLPALGQLERRVQATPLLRGTLNDPVKFGKMVEFYRNRLAEFQVK